MINRAFTSAMNYFQFQVHSILRASDNGTVDISTKAPYIKYDPTTGLYSLFTDTYSTGTPNDSVSGTKQETLTISMNAELWGLLGTFPGIIQPDGSVKIKIDNQLGSNIHVPSSTTTGLPDTSKGVYLETKQNYPSTTMLWCPIDSIVFTSSLLPNMPEMVGLSYKSGIDKTVSTLISTNNNFQPIISDFSVYLSNANGYTEFINYSPQGEYRMIALSSSVQDIRNIDLQIFWKHRLTNQYIPLKLYNNSSISIKIMFRKKKRNSTFG